MFFGADRLAQFNIQSGEELLVSFDIDAHEYQGRWFNSIRAWNIQRVDPNAVAGAMGGMQPGAFPPVGAPVAPAQPAAPANGATAAFLQFSLQLLQQRVVAQMIFLSKNRKVR